MDPPLGLRLVSSLAVSLSGPDDPSNGARGRLLDLATNRLDVVGTPYEYYCITGESSSLEL